MKYLLMVVLLFSFGQANDAYRTGNQLLEDCEATDEGWVRKGFCRGYIVAVVDTSEGKAWDGAPYCEPDGVNIGQLTKIVTKHLNENPNQLHLSAFSLVQSALLEAFPCE